MTNDRTSDRVGPQRDCSQEFGCLPKKMAEDAGGETLGKAMMFYREMLDVESAR